MSDRLLLWPAFGRQYSGRVVRQLCRHPIGEEIRAAKYRAVLLTADTPCVPDWLTVLNPLTLLGLRPAMAAHRCKIEAPLMFPEATASVIMDADLDWAPGLCDQMPLLFEAAERFGFVVTQHPRTTWMGEPLAPAQGQDYCSRAGMKQFAPLYMLGVIARAHWHPTCVTLTRAWQAEFEQHPTREQPTFAAAVWRTGLAPLACPMSLLSWPADAAPVGGLVPLFRHAPEIATSCAP